MNTTKPASAWIQTSTACHLVGSPHETRDQSNETRERLPASWHDCKVAEKQILDLTLELRQVTAQRDELLAACKNLVRQIERDNMSGRYNIGKVKVAIEASYLSNSESNTAQH